MSALLDPTEFESVFPRTAEHATREQIEWALEAARDELLELVGEDALLAAENLSDLDAKGKRLRRATGHLANAGLIPEVAPVSIRRQQDAQAGGVTNEYFDPAKVKEMCEGERASALRAIAPYLLRDAAGDEFQAGAEFSHPEEAVCTDFTC